MDISGRFVVDLEHFMMLVLATAWGCLNSDSDYTTIIFPRVRKSVNFPDRKIFTAKTFRIKCVIHDIDDFATNVRKT